MFLCFVLLMCRILMLLCVDRYLKILRLVVFFWLLIKILVFILFLLNEMGVVVF